MFTGIVQDIGTVTDIAPKGDWLLTIKTGQLSLAHTPIGASISCSGVCLTVISKTTDTFQAQASSETLSKTTIRNWHAGTPVNLEPALRMGDELGGHLVTGHVDDVIRVTSRMQDGESLRLQFSLPQSLSRFIAAKGSVVIDGTSLTVNEVSTAHFGVNIIPHTQAATTLGALHMDDEVNIEIDMVARYLDRLTQRS